MTKNYINFQNRVNEIKKGLNLDSPFLVEKVDEYQECTKAFILLIHAELEKYFETISMQIVTDSFKTFKERGTINKPLLSLLSSPVYEYKAPKYYSDKENKKDAKLKDRIGHFIDAYTKNIVKKNNGIKGKDIFKMLWTIGFSKEDVGESLIIGLNNYGSKRGTLAHCGTIGTATSLNYENEIKKVDEIKTELLKFDSLVESNNYLRPETAISSIEAILYKKDDDDEDYAEDEEADSEEDDKE